MLLSKTTTQKWNSKNKNRYIDLGYCFTKMKDEFEVKVEDLPTNSNAYVIIKCDYCGKEYLKKYSSYTSLHRDMYIDNDCCTECKSKKILNTFKEKYGDYAPCHAPEFEEKRKKTNIERYGVENVFANEQIKDKIYKTSFEKYGVKNYNQSQEAKDNYKRVCMERYGVPYFLMLNYSGDKIKGSNSPRWKGGVEHTRQERATCEYISWRKSVFERDHFICQCCFKKAKNFNAHHLYNWKDYPDLRYDINNGVTLCMACHNRFHSIYGKSYNTPDQYYEFIGQGKKIC